MKWSSEKEDKFLYLLAETGNVSATCRQVPCAKSSAYKRKATNPEFRRKWEEAIDSAVDMLELEARRRAIYGVDEPVFYKGAVVGSVRKYSDVLLIFLLKGHRPDKYRDNYRLEGHINHGSKDGSPIVLKLADDDNLVESDSDSEL